MSQNNEPNASARAASARAAMQKDEQRKVADQLASQMDEFVTEISEELSAISLLLGDRPLEISLTSPATRPTVCPRERAAAAGPTKAADTSRLNQLKQRLANLRETEGASDE